MRALVLIGLLSALAAPAVAAARPALLAQDTGLSGAQPRADPRFDGILYSTSPQTVVLRHDTGASSRSYTVPPYCLPGARSRTQVAINCMDQSLLLDLATGATTHVDPGLGGYETYGVAGVGRRWLQMIAQSTSSVHGPTVSYLLDRRTGKRIDLARDPFGVHRVIDLDRPSGARPLCRAARRHRAEGDPITTYSESTLVGGRFIEGNRITNCRTGRTRRLPATTDAFAVNAGYLSDESVDDTTFAGAISLCSLTSGRTWRYPFVEAPGRSYGSPVLSAHALWTRRDDSVLLRATLR